jgi:outer membrane protein assembly factor BamB
MEQKNNWKGVVGVVAVVVAVVAGLALYMAQPEELALGELEPVGADRAVVLFRPYGEDTVEQLAVVDALRRRLVWRRDAPRGENDFYAGNTLVSSLAVSLEHGVVVVHASRLMDAPAMLTGVSLETGETIWERELPSAADRRGPGVEAVGDVLLTMSSSYGLRALRVTDGEPLWAVEDGERLDAYRVHEGHVIVWEALDVAQVRDLRTGEIKATLSDAAPDRKPRFSNALCLREGALTWLVDAEADATKQLMTLDLKGYTREAGPLIGEGDLGVGFWSRCATYQGDLVFSAWSDSDHLWAAHFVRLDPETGERRWLTKLEGGVDNPLFLEPAEWAYLNGPVTRYVPVLASKSEGFGELSFKGSVLDMDTGEVRSERAEWMSSDRIFVPKQWRLAGTPWWMIQARDGDRNVLALFDGDRGVLASGVKTPGLYPASLDAQGDTFWMYGYSYRVDHTDLGWYDVDLPTLETKSAGTETPLEPAGEWVMGWLGGE